MFIDINIANKARFLKRASRRTMGKVTGHKSKLKLMAGIIMPVLVMIITVVMVGVSFAWFTEISTAQIATLSLTTKRTFTLTFDVNGRSVSTPYAGETAIGTDGYLVTGYRAAQKNLPYGEASWRKYMLDNAYSFKTSIALDTQNIPIDLTMTLDTALITYTDIEGDGGTEIRDAYGIDVASGKKRDAKDIPYAFTWCFSKTGDGTSTLFTPYGKLELDADGYASALDGVAVTESTSILGAEPKGLTDFVANKTEMIGGEEKTVTYDFYIIFAPQKLYWMQYFKADRDRSLADVYTAAEREHIESADFANQMYYSVMTYLGADFAFTATIDVTEIHWDKEESGV